MAKLNRIINGEQYEEEIKKIERSFVYNPNNYDSEGSENIIKRMNMDHEKLVVQMQVSGIADPMGMTVRQFYVAVKYLTTRKNGQKLQSR